MGVVAGISAGLFGIGGGIISVPALLLGLELIDMNRDVLAYSAIGTSLACFGFTRLGLTVAHHKKGTVMRLWVICRGPFLIRSEGGTIRTPSIPFFAFARPLTGWVSSMMGIAGCALTVLFMTSHGTPVRDATGISSAFGILTAFAGAISFVAAGLDHPGRPDWAFGYMYMQPLIGIIAISTVSTPLGARLAHSLDQKLLQQLFATSLAVLPAHLIWTFEG